MRTTITIDEALLAEAKELAARERRSMSDIVDEGLRFVIAQRKEAAEQAPIKLPTVGGGGILPGVDLDDSAALLDLMDRNDSGAGR